MTILACPLMIFDLCNSTRPFQILLPLLPFQLRAPAIFSPRAGTQNSWHKIIPVTLIQWTVLLLGLVTCSLNQLYLTNTNSLMHIFLLRVVQTFWWNSRRRPNPEQSHILKVSLNMNFLQLHSEMTDPPIVQYPRMIAYLTTPQAN